MLSQDAPAGSVRLPSGPFSRVYALEGPKRDVVVKLGPPSSSLREAAALQDVRLAIAPEVIAVAEGVLVLERLPGETVPPDRLGTTRATALGAVVRRLHDSYVAAAGGWPDWPDGAHDLQDYHAQVVDVVRDLATSEHRDLAQRVLAGLPTLPAADEPGFRRLHGDLWSGNVVWAATTRGSSTGSTRGAATRRRSSPTWSRWTRWAPSASTRCWRATTIPPSASASRPGARSRPSARGSGTPTSASASARRSCSARPPG